MVCLDFFPFLKNFNTDKEFESDLSVLLQPAIIKTQSFIAHMINFSEHSHIFWGLEGSRGSNKHR